MPCEETAHHTSHLCTMQKMLVKFMWTVWRPAVRLLLIHIT